MALLIGGDDAQASLTGKILTETQVRNHHRALRIRHLDNPHMAQWKKILDASSIRPQQQFPPPPAAPRQGNLAGCFTAHEVVRWVVSSPSLPLLNQPEPLASGYHRKCGHSDCQNDRPSRDAAPGSQQLASTPVQTLVWSRWRLTKGMFSRHPSTLIHSLKSSS